ncbi:unnamed protein product [Ectocarpus sp. 8 AP-2014]
MYVRLARLSYARAFDYLKKEGQHKGINSARKWKMDDTDRLPDRTQQRGGTLYQLLHRERGTDPMGREKAPSTSFITKHHRRLQPSLSNLTNIQSNQSKSQFTSCCVSFSLVYTQDQEPKLF